jgi:hypothetical protein
MGAFAEFPPPPPAVNWTVNAIPAEATASAPPSGIQLTILSPVILAEARGPEAAPSLTMLSVPSVATASSVPGFASIVALAAFPYGIAAMPEPGISLLATTPVGNANAVGPVPSLSVGGGILVTPITAVASSVAPVLGQQFQPGAMSAIAEFDSPKIRINIPVSPNGPPTLLSVNAEEAQITSVLEKAILLKVE